MDSPQIWSRWLASGRMVGFFLTAAFVLAAGPASGLTIITNYRAPGQTLGSLGRAGAAPSNTTGMATLQEIVGAAASYWEDVILDSFTLTISYGWIERDSYATHSGGSIGFDNDLSTRWFMDSTPLDASEFALYTEYSENLGGGVMNTGREFTGGSGDAAYVDIFTTALHEIGHALGLSSGNFSYVLEAGDGDIDIKSPRPFAGARIPVSSAHISLPHALLRSSRGPGIRRLPSEADILAIAQLRNFRNLNLNPVSIPEPSIPALLGLAVCGWAGWRRVRARRA